MYRLAGTNTAHWSLLDKMVPTISQGSVVTSASGVAESIPTSYYKLTAKSQSESI